MASKSPVTLVTPRDRDLLAALERCPLTIQQLLRLSVTFAYPFTTERRVQERLQRLTAVGRVHRWLYATAGQGMLSYFTVSPLGFRLLHPECETLPGRGLCHEVGIARQAHTHALAEVLVSLFVAAKAAGVTIEDFHRENVLRLTHAGESLYPDAAFALRSPSGECYRFFLELDNATLFPHLGSASVYTRDAMGQLVVDNLATYAERKPPKTPVPETPFKGW